MYSRLKNALYLFQLENYYRWRFFKSYLPFLFVFSPAPPRSEIKWTPKAISLFVVAVFISPIFSVLLPLALFYFNLLPQFFSFFLIPIFLLFSYFLFFLFLILASFLIWPAEALAKYVRLMRARSRLSSAFPNLKIIGLTGSFGKTTVKNILASVLSAKYKVFMTPDSVNTPLGIADVILNQLPADTEIFIVEMGAYRRGDIKKLCSLTPPDVSVLTGINESHLERFGSLKNTIKAKFEIVQYAKPDAPVILNADNEHLVANYKSYIGSKKPLWYTSTKHILAKFQARNFIFRPDGTGLSFSLINPQYEVGPIKVPLLGEYIVGVINASVLIAESLGLSLDDMHAGFSKIKPIPHRLEPRPGQNGVLVVDDSYNGNPDGVKEALRVLVRFPDRRRLFVTPGLVEMGKESERIHRSIGHELAASADLIILIKNSVTPFIKSALFERGFSANNIKEFSSMNEVVSALPSLIKPNDIILFQNDWPDNYR